MSSRSPSTGTSARLLHQPADAQHDFRAASPETLRQLVAAGLGFAPLPALAIPDGQQELAGAAVRPFARRASRRIGLICRTTYSSPGRARSARQSRGPPSAGRRS
jgi:DNA-binding transcriptional LysR family regulator